MKRLLFGLLTITLVALGAVHSSKDVAAQNANNFTIESFDAKYTLDQDNEGRSSLKTTETIKAVFPTYDQNHGLERAFPKKYDGHSTSLKVLSVVDGSGKKLSYSETTADDNLLLRIGDAGTYVHGAHTYVITYTQRDVTRFFSNTNDDEFYWDVNGTQWQQPMGKVSMGLHVSAKLAGQLTDNQRCYKGTVGSTDQCTISKIPQEDGTIFIAEATDMRAFENMTIAVGFKPHTFAGYQQTPGEKILVILFIIWIAVQVVGSVIAIGAIIWMLIKRYRVMNRAKGRGTIIPEYLPPNEASVLASAKMLGNVTCDMAAQIIDLAVRHYLKIYQTKDKTLFKPAEYELEIAKDTSDLRTEELRLLSDLFGGSMAIGSRFEMKKLQSNSSMSQKLTASRKALRKDVRGKYELFERAEKEARDFKLVGIIAIALGVVTLSPLIIIAAIIAFSIAYTLWPRTEKGVTLRDYLLGLKEYITVAEEDRIKMLQSPEGAEKVGVKVDKNDTKQLVTLYERVLPYAVLFNVEKEWAKQLGAYYETSSSQPDWYVGNTAFNAVVFSSALSSFSSQSSSYSSSSSSSSGGSSGGGSSGGGGGCGGGGGW